MITAAERRRSARMWMTISLRVEGVDSSGRTIEYEGRAIEGCDRKFYGATFEARTCPKPAAD